MKKTTLIITAVLIILYLLIQHGRHLVPERESGIKTLLDQIPRNSQINERQRSLQLAAVGLTEMIPITVDVNGNGQVDEPVPLDDHVIAATSDGEALWVLGTNSIQRFGLNLDLKARVERDLHLSPRSDQSPSTPPYNREGALDVASGMAFISVDGMLRILGSDGRELGRLELPEAAQDLIVRDGFTYMISSTGESFWAHKVDVSDPEHPSITWEKEIFLENGHLGVQWVDTQQLFDKKSVTWFFTVTDPDNKRPLVLPTPEYLTPYYLYQVNQDGTIKKDTVRQVEPWRVTPEIPVWALQKIGSRMRLILMMTTTRERVAVEAIRTSQQRQRLLQQRQMPLQQWQNPLQGQQEEVETGTLKRMLDGWEPQDNVTSLTLEEEVTNTVATGLVRSGNRIFAVIDRTLHIVDITDIYNLRLLGKVELPAPPVDLVQIR